MRSSLCNRCIVAVRRLMDSNKHVEALGLLDTIKSKKIAIRNVDLFRAYCFSLSTGNPFSVRQALLEELRHFPDNAEARTALHDVEVRLDEVLQPPDVIQKEEPLFALLYDALKAHTMLSWDRLFSIYMCVKEMCVNEVPGAFVECGVAGGGSLILSAVVAKHYSRSHRRVMGFDTFTGMPAPTLLDTLHDTQTPASATNWGEGTCSAPMAHVSDLANNFSVEVELIPGLFQDTLPRSFPARTSSNGPPEEHSVAFAHLDADWYESTVCALNHLYPSMTPKSILQIDDFGYWGGCRRATQEFVDSHQLGATLQTVGCAATIRLP